MSHRALSIAIVSALIVSFAAQSAEARSKSFCRRWAAGVANNNILYEQQAADKAKPQQKAATGKGSPPAKEPSVEALAGGGLGGTLTRMSKPPRWHQVYSQAYADCRVVNN